MAFHLDGHFGGWGSCGQSVVDKGGGVSAGTYLSGGTDPGNIERYNELSVLSSITECSIAA